MDLFTPYSSVPLPRCYPTEAALSAFQQAAAFPQGWEVYVGSTDKTYLYYPAGTPKGGLPADPGHVVVAFGGGRFVVPDGGGSGQTAYAEIDAAVQLTEEAGMGPLLTVELTTTGGDLEVFSSFSCTNDTAGGRTGFLLFLDGVNMGPDASSGAGVTSVAGASETLPNGDPQAGALNQRTAEVPAGAHTVVLQWVVNTSGSVSRIDPASQNHATLLVKEVFSG